MEIIDVLKSKENIFLVVSSKDLRDFANYLLKNSETTNNEEIQFESNQKLIFGISGLASFLGVSTVTAQKIKNEQCFPIYQRGRTIVFKPDEVLAGMKTKKSTIKVKKYNYGNK